MSVHSGRLFAVVAVTVFALVSGARWAVRGFPPSELAVAVGERVVRLPPGGVAAVAVDVSVGRRVERLALELQTSGAPVSAAFRHGVGGGPGAVLELAVAPAASPGVHDTVVVARAGSRRAVAPLRVVVAGRDAISPGPRPPAPRPIDGWVVHPSRW